MGSGEKKFRNLRSAMREHFSEVFGITKSLQFGGSVEGEKNPEESKDEIIALVSVFKVCLSEGYISEASCSNRERSAGTKRFQTESGIG